LASLRRGVATLRELTALLGLFREAPQSDAETQDRLVGPLMELLIQLRAESRQRKDFAMADQIRDRLGKIGITLEDRKDGTIWRSS
jgi:cysteinyl-tRNA synthetase